MKIMFDTQYTEINTDNINKILTMDIDLTSFYGVWKFSDGVVFYVYHFTCIYSILRRICEQRFFIF